MSPAFPRSARFAPLALLFAAASGLAADFDRAHTRIGFELRTRWGQQLQGRFPDYEGAVRRLPDGRSQVVMRLRTETMEIIGYPRYTEFSRSEKFFDVERYPAASFTSDPYPAALLKTGGKLSGQLRIHGVSQAETFTIEPATCHRPALDCDVIVHGSVRREDYGMDAWQVAIHGRVRFELRLRLQDSATP